MKVAIALNFISVVLGALLYFVIAMGMGLAATRSAEIGAMTTLVIGWGSALIALIGALTSILVSNKVVKCVKNKQGRRRVYISYYEPYFRLARERLATEEGQ